MQSYGTPDIDCNQERFPKTQTDVRFKGVIDDRFRQVGKELIFVNMKFKNDYLTFNITDRVF